MAEEKKIVIEIVTKSEEPKEENDDNTKKNKEIKGSNKSQKSNNNNTSIILAKAVVASTVALAKRVVMDGIQRNYSLTENYIAQNDMRNLQTAINKVGGFTASIGGGFAVGGVPGAVIGAVTWGANEFVSYQKRMSGYNQQLNATNYQTAFDRSRLGLTNEGRGTEN